MKILLVDQLNIMYRWYFAMARDPLKAGELHTSGLYGLFENILRIRRDFHIDHVILCDDCDGDTFRHKQYPEYKAGRTERPEELDESIKHVPRLAEALGIPIVKQDSLEADDLIGTYARMAESEGHEVYIYSNDKDLCQLVSDKVFVLRSSSKHRGYEVWTPKKVCEEWQIKEPIQLIEILALQGDSSDAYKGLPGCGPKGATKFIAEYGSVQGLYNHLEYLSSAQRSKLSANEEQVLLCHWLATIRCDLEEHLPPLEDLFQVQPHEDEVIQETLKDYRMYSILQMIYGDAT